MVFSKRCMLVAFQRRRRCNRTLYPSMVNALLASLLWGMLATPASPESLSKALARASEIHVRRLTTRLEWHGPWRPDSTSNWTRRPSRSEQRLTSRQRMILARSLADTVLKKPRPPRRLEIGPEDCDFLLTLRGPTGIRKLLLSFPEAEARWPGPDSTIRVNSFEGGVAKVIGILRKCFPHDSTVQDLPAAVSWFRHNPTMVGDGDGVVPYYEGVPTLLTQVPCEYPNVEHPPSGVFTVYIEALIDRRGSVSFARVKQGIPLLDAGALECVRRRQYRPAQFEGHPFGFRLTIPVDYKFFE